MPAPLPRDFGNDANVFMDKDGNLILWAGGFDHALGGYVGAIKLTKRAEVVAPTPTPTKMQTPTPVLTPSPTLSSSPTPNPTVKVSLPTQAPVAKKTTITCIKGKTVKKVTAVNPKCPSGYKKK